MSEPSILSTAAQSDPGGDSSLPDPLPNATGSSVDQEPKSKSTLSPFIEVRAAIGYDSESHELQFISVTETFAWKGGPSLYKSHEVVGSIDVDQAENRIYESLLRLHAFHIGVPTLAEREGYRLDANETTLEREAELREAAAEAEAGSE